jgi:hypothetical protein
MFFSKFLFVHTVEREVDLPPELIMENICDFEHVGFVHKKCFSYNKVIKRCGSVTVLEYGVRHIPFLPFFVTHYFMIHERISPFEVTHLAKNKSGGPWIRSRMLLSERNVNGRKGSLYISTHESLLPFFYKPFKKILIIISNYWGNIVWQEDYEICRKRLLLKEMGFSDGPLCGAWVEKLGEISYVANFLKFD